VHTPVWKHNAVLYFILAIVSHSVSYCPVDLLSVFRLNALHPALILAVKFIAAEAMQPAELF
jgi:hypothetical protein